MRRIKVKTESGSTYVFDNEGMTWSRVNDNPGHETIRYLESVNGGSLAAPVHPVVGSGLTFFLPGDTWVRTTRVVSVEEL